MTAAAVAWLILGIIGAGLLLTAAALIGLVLTGRRLRASDFADGTTEEPSDPLADFRSGGAI